MSDLRDRLHALVDEIADAIEARPRDERADNAERAKPRRRPAKLRVVRPEGDNDEVAAAKARRFLRDNGVPRSRT